jgi:hypothetical protein
MDIAYVVRGVISVLGQQREGDITLTKLTGIMYMLLHNLNKQQVEYIRRMNLIKSNSKLIMANMSTTWSI